MDSKSRHHHLQSTISVWGPPSQSICNPYFQLFSQSIKAVFNTGLRAGVDRGLGLTSVSKWWDDWDDGCTFWIDLEGCWVESKEQMLNIPKCSCLNISLFRCSFSLLLKEGAGGRFFRSCHSVKTKVLCIRFCCVIKNAFWPFLAGDNHNKKSHLQPRIIAVSQQSSPQNNFLIH